MNREKVRKGLECCTDMVCPDECPYKRSDYCQKNLHHDALECLERPGKIDKVFKGSAIAFVWLAYPVVLYKIFQLIFGR